MPSTPDGSRLSTEAEAIARARASEDRDLLAKLILNRKVARSDPPSTLEHPEVALPFIADIQRRVKARSTIRPNAKKAKAKKKGRKR